MKTKKTIAMILAAASLAGLLAGCGGGGTDVPDQPQQDGDAAQAYQDALDRQQQAEDEARQAEIDAVESNTKPYGSADDVENRGSGDGLAGLGDDDGQEDGDTDAPAPSEQDAMPALTRAALGVPEWSGQPWVQVNGGTPFFQMPDGKPKQTETYSSLDAYRRPGQALAVIADEPSRLADYICTVQEGTLSVPGWNMDAYPGIVGNPDTGKISDGVPDDGKLLYLRRLVGGGLGYAEQGRRNSIVCTEYMGEYGLRALEDAVLRYRERTGRRVVYRVTPVFEGKEQLARGVLVEAMSYGDTQAEIGSGMDLCFNMFVYNVQPGIRIDYMTGKTDVDDGADSSLASTMCGLYVLDTARKQAHMGLCHYLTGDVHPAVQSFYYGSTASLAAWSIDWNTCGCMDGVEQDGTGAGQSGTLAPEADPDEDAPEDPGRQGTVNVGLEPGTESGGGNE